MSGRTHGGGLNRPGDAPGWAPLHEAAGVIGRQVPPSRSRTVPGGLSSVACRHSDEKCFHDGSEL